MKIRQILFFIVFAIIIFTPYSQYPARASIVANSNFETWAQKDMPTITTVHYWRDWDDWSWKRRYYQYPYYYRPYYWRPYRDWDRGDWRWRRHHHRHHW